MVPPTPSTEEETDPFSETLCSLEQRSPTDGSRTISSPRENFGGSWRNLDIICIFYVYCTVSLYSYFISNKQQQISH
jgi:hypothetical protein